MQPESLKKQLKLIHEAHRRRDRDTKGDRSTLSFATEPFNDKGLELLTKMRPDLRGIYLMQTKITDAAIPLLNRFRCLEELIVSGTELTSDAMKELNVPSLVELGVPFHTLSQTAASRLATYPRLASLDISTSGLMREVKIEEYEERIRELCDSQSLKRLKLKKGLTGSCYEALSHCRQLEEGRFINCGGSPEQRSAIFKKRNWKVLIFSHSPVPEELFEQLRGMDQLDCLGISGIPVPDELVEIIVSLPNLTNLWLEDIDISPDDAGQLKNCPKLKAFEGRIDHLSYDFWCKTFEGREDFWLHPC